MTSFESMARGSPYFTADLRDWDVSSALSMNHIFAGAADFNSDLSKWDVSRVQEANSIFENTERFNSHIRCDRTTPARPCVPPPCYTRG